MNWTLGARRVAVTRLDALRALLARTDDEDLQTEQGVKRGHRVIEKAPAPKVREAWVYRVMRSIERKRA